MILEHADIRIDPARAADFEAAILHGVQTVISQAKGFKGFKVNRSIESLPLGTLLANLLGGLLIGAAVAWLARHPELSPLWPVINKRKDPLPDATEWDGKPNKLPLLER